MEKKDPQKPRKNADKSATLIAREQRLKAALRENLHRRKAQDRAREAEDTAGNNN